MAQPRAVTIRDVAQHAGVSKSLVSLVLRGESGVSEHRRQAVLEAIAQLEYRPNRAARSLSTARSGIVGVLLEDLRNPWYVDLLEGLTSTLQAVDLTPVLTDATMVRHVGGDPVASLTSVGVDGIVVVGSTTEEAALREAAEHTPVVLAGTRHPQLPNSDFVADDDEAGGWQATQHLLGLGHRQIAHLRGPGEVGDLRLAGYRKALATVGAEGLETVVAGGNTEESGYAAARRVLALQTPPTAIFAYNDIVALGALSAASDVGALVPEDLSVVGFDNTYLSRVRHISLTTVDNGNYAVGVQAGRYLVDRITEPGQAPRSHQVATTLFVRATSGLAPES